MENNWQPSASLEALRNRAEILARIRAFFVSRHVLEVETPLLSESTITDQNLFSLETKCRLPGSKAGQTLYLQTSPEFAMKRLLAFGSGSIYQICKAFRDQECGRFHQPEFTMLEWYRVGFDHHDLMNEMDEFLQYVLQTLPAERSTYTEVFQRYLHINPLALSVNELKNCAIEHGLDMSLPLACDNDRDVWLNVLISHFIEPHLGQDCPMFLYDFPASQAALSRIRNDEFPVAERFEVYIKGIELANGFHELTCANEQRQRFNEDLKKRKLLGFSELPIDENLLAALDHGLPNCAGVALGVDRLVMIACQAKSLHEIISFTF